MLGVYGAVVRDCEGCLTLGTNLGDSVFGGVLDLVDEVVDDVNKDDFVTLGENGMSVKVLICLLALANA